MTVFLEGEYIRGGWLISHELCLASSRTCGFLIEFNPAVIPNSWSSDVFFLITNECLGWPKPYCGICSCLMRRKKVDLGTRRKRNPKRKGSTKKTCSKTLHFGVCSYYLLWLSVVYSEKYLKTEQIRILETPWSGRHSLSRWWFLFNAAGISFQWIISM